MGCNLMRCNSSTLLYVQLIWLYFVAGNCPTTPNSKELCSCTRFPTGLFVYGKHPWITMHGALEEHDNFLRTFSQFEN